MGFPPLIVNVPKIVKPLSAKELAALPFKESDYFISCGSHLLVKVSGKTKTKRFWCCYTWDGKTEKIAIPRENLFPACSISRAREKVAKIIELWESADTPTAKARWVLNYIDFQIYSKVYKTNLFH